MPHFTVTIPEELYEIITEIDNLTADQADKRAELLEIRNFAISNIQSKFEKSLDEMRDRNDRQFCNTLAFLLLHRQHTEIVKNCIDAKARSMHVTFNQRRDEKIEIHIDDDGSQKIPDGKQGRYDWRKALLESSEKKNTNALGGCNAGLAELANFLEKIGDGELQLSQRTEGGARVTLISSALSCEYDLDCFHFINYIREMLNDIQKEHGELKNKLDVGGELTLDEDEQILMKLFETIIEKYKPGEFVSRRDRLLSSPQKNLSFLASTSFTPGATPSPTSTPFSPDSADKSLSVEEMSASRKRQKRKPPSLFTQASVGIVGIVEIVETKTPSPHIQLGQ